MCTFHIGVLRIKTVKLQELESTSGLMTSISMEYGTKNGTKMALNLLESPLVLVKIK